MFDDKGELLVPVVGFVLLGFAALFMGFAVMNAEWDFFLVTATSTMPVLGVSGLLLLITAFFSFKRAFMIEGMTFGIFGMLFVAAAIGVDMSVSGSVIALGFVGIVLCIIALMVAYMSHRIGDMFITLIALFSVIAMAPLGFVDHGVAAAISGIGFVFVAFFALFYAFMDWMLVQDIAEDYADFMYGDNDCCCCDDEECDCVSEEECSCGCEAHSEEPAEIECEEPKE